MIYSIVETAKANYLNVYQYFELLLTEIPKHMNDTDLKFIDELLPWAPRVQETYPSRSINFGVLGFIIIFLSIKIICFKNYLYCCTNCIKMSFLSFPNISLFSFLTLYEA